MRTPRARSASSSAAAAPLRGPDSWAQRELSPPAEPSAPVRPTTLKTRLSLFNQQRVAQAEKDARQRIERIAAARQLLRASLEQGERARQLLRASLEQGERARRESALRGRQERLGALAELGLRIPGAPSGKERASDAAARTAGRATRVEAPEHIPPLSVPALRQPSGHLQPAPSGSSLPAWRTAAAEPRSEAHLSLRPEAVGRTASPGRATADAAAPTSRSVLTGPGEKARAASGASRELAFAERAPPAARAVLEFGDGEWFPPVAAPLRLAPEAERPWHRPLPHARTEPESAPQSAPQSAPEQDEFVFASRDPAVAPVPGWPAAEAGDLPVAAAANVAEPPVEDEEDHALHFPGRG